MAVQPVMTAEEWCESVGRGRPPTADDVTILWDGRRIDSKEAALQWIAEFEAERAADIARDSA